MTQTKTQSRLINWTLAAVVMLLLSAALEGGARLWEKYHPRPRVATYIWDWDRMWASDFYTVGSASAGWPPGEEFNADGLRDRAHPVEKPPRTQRVVFLGDSVTMGHGIEAAQAYPQVLQRQLDDEGRAVEIFNVALQGWSTRQERIAYDTLARRYAPDLVVLAICLNDIAELQNNLSRPPAWLLSWHRRSALVRVLVNASGREIHDVEELFGAQESQRVHDGYERLFSEVRALRDSVQGGGGRLALLLLPFRFQVLPGAPPPSAQQKLAGFARAESIPLLDLLPGLVRRGPSMFIDYDHLSPDGSTAVAGELRASGWLSAQDSGAQAFGRQSTERETTSAEHALILALEHQDAAVRQAAARDLAHHGPGGTSALKRALESDSDLGVRRAAAKSLGELKDPAAVPALYRALADSSENVRWAAAEALSTLPQDARIALDPLIAALRSGDAYVRGFAAWALGQLGPSAAPALPALLTALREETRNRGVVAQALASLGPQAAAALPALIEMLTSTEAQRRANGAHALGRLGPVAAASVPPLTQALRDADPHVRTEAARALGRIGKADAAVVTALAQALRDQDEQVRLIAARALGWLGPRAQAAAPMLERAQSDESERVAGEAERALEKLR
jgi:HEAT repeat protein/lysophospholipase L1-like esterase